MLFFANESYFLERNNGGLRTKLKIFDFRSYTFCLFLGPKPVFSLRWYYCGRRRIRTNSHVFNRLVLFWGIYRSTKFCFWGVWSYSAGWPCTKLRILGFWSYFFPLDSSLSSGNALPPHASDLFLREMHCRPHASDLFLREMHCRPPRLVVFDRDTW